MADQNAVRKDEVGPSSLSGSPRRLEFGEVAIVGKCIEHRPSGKGRDVDHYHTIVLPAVDPFTAPPVVSVRADDELYREGDDVRCIASVGGYRQKITFTDKKTGEDQKYYKVNMTMQFVSKF